MVHPESRPLALGGALCDGLTVGVAAAGAVRRFRFRVNSVRLVLGGAGIGLRKNLFQVGR
jgi:hypothetical protein